MFNKAILIGRLTADPELKQTPNGVAVTTFTIAVDRGYASKTGERTADFIEIVAWRTTAEFVCKYFSKGKLILVEGSIQVRSYVDKNGNNRRAWEVVAENCRFAESKNSQGGSGGFNVPLPSEDNAPPQSMASSAPASYSSGSVEDFSEVDDDGDLPF